MFHRLTMLNSPTRAVRWASSAAFRRATIIAATVVYTAVQFTGAGEPKRLPLVTETTKNTVKLHPYRLPTVSRENSTATEPLISRTPFELVLFSQSLNGTIESLDFNSGIQRQMSATFAGQVGNRVERYDSETYENDCKLGSNPQISAPFEVSPIKQNEFPTPVADRLSQESSVDILSDFSPTPIPYDGLNHDGQREQYPYDTKHDVPTQYPWMQWGRTWYGDGITPRGIDIFGPTNLVRPKFYVYGDFRTAFAAGRNALGRTDNWASRLNLDMDFQITDTERFHGFVGPLDNNNQFTRIEKIGDKFVYQNEINLTPVTGFFEGDLGVLMGATQSRTSPFELPFTIGLVPLLYQNGVWMEDAVTGAAFALPSRNSRLLNWSNYDATFFAVVDQLNSDAFGKDQHAAQAFGTAWFIDAYGGYIEAGYAFLNDRNQRERSYHNATVSFTRRYFDRISNSVRVIVNSGQDLDKEERTADGGLLLIENSWVTNKPLTFVPYANFFYGWDRPQSVARAAAAGGILRNTGINFETDGLNGLATLDPNAADTAGGAIGVDLIADDLGHQLLLELAYVTPHSGGSAVVPDDQYAAGTRFQVPVSNRTLIRFDAMYGWRGDIGDVYGTRMEYRWKF